MPVPDILRRREKGFVLWIPRGQSQAAGPLIGTVRNTIDCRNLGFVDGSQAINYVTSQFVEGFRQSRLLDMLRNVDSSEKRIKLAFACLLTAVGIPQRLAGEEFADEQDDLAEVPDRPRLARVNFERLNSSDSDAAMRRRVFEYVSRLIHFRTSTPALWVNDVEFIHVDLNGKQVIAWKRGGPGVTPVIVIANFSEFQTPPGGEYVVPTWPQVAAEGKRWVEVTQSRTVEPAWIGREPLYSWEAKIYTLMDIPPAQRAA